MYLTKEPLGGGRAAGRDAYHGRGVNVGSGVNVDVTWGAEMEHEQIPLQILGKNEDAGGE